jgi:hypothetical protein
MGWMQCAGRLEARIEPFRFDLRELRSAKGFYPCHLGYMWLLDSEERQNIYREESFRKKRVRQKQYTHRRYQEFGDSNISN